MFLCPKQCFNKLAILTLDFEFRVNKRNQLQNSQLGNQQCQVLASRYTGPAMSDSHYSGPCTTSQLEASILISQSSSMVAGIAGMCMYKRRQVSMHWVTSHVVVSCLC